MAQKAELISRVTDAILKIEGTTPDDIQRARIYCLINEVPDGGWGFASIAITKEYSATRLRALKEAKA